MKNGKFMKTAVILVCLCTGVLTAYSTYEGCADLKESDFRHQRIITKVDLGDQLLVDPTLLEPVEFAFDPVSDDQGNMYVDIYFTERRGKIKYYDARQNRITVLGTFGQTFGDPVRRSDPTDENGVGGIALDPDFKNNRRIYFYYSPEIPEGMVFRVVRYTLGQDNLIQDDSERILIDIPGTGSCCHSGGSLAFDAYGDLWISVGDQSDYRCTDPRTGKNANFLSTEEFNCSGLKGPANTKSGLGGILRIRLDDNDPRGYTIPEGNFGEYFASVYSDRADEFLDTSRVMPEVYAKGMRNPYTMTLDPVRRWVTWGDCGPDSYHGVTFAEEHNLITRPAFAGWPFFAGPNLDVNGGVLPTDPLAPVNPAPFNTGLELLPPAEEPIHPYERDCAMTGPIYRYDPDLASGIKLPPHFHRRWFIMDWNKSWIKSATLNDAGDEILQLEDVFTGSRFYWPMESEIGPDGALYVLSYGTVWWNANQNTYISRIEYTGDCLPGRDAFTGVVEKVGCTDEQYEEYDPDATHMLPGSCQTVNVNARRTGGRPGAVVSGRTISVKVSGRHEISITDITGAVVWKTGGSGRKEYDIPVLKRAGLYLLTVTTDTGRMTEKVIVND